MTAASCSRLAALPLMLVCACERERDEAAPAEPEPRTIVEPPREPAPEQPATRPADVPATKREARRGGAGFGGRGERAPKLVRPKAEIIGALEHDVVERTIRKHIGEVRACYNIALTPCPNLHHRVAIEFEILPSGKVGAVKVRESTLKDERVPACIVEAVERWCFAKPEDGEPVTVIYPFVLSPG